jgi:uncharacterized membrane protein
MTVFARLVFVLVLVVTPIVVFVTSLPLPAQVATHFGRGGLANGWMTHDGYIAFMLVMSTVIPLVVAGATGLLRRMALSMIRRRAATLDGTRLEDTIRWLGGHAAWVGILLSVLFLGMHFLMLEANGRTPARLDEGAFFAVMIAFVVLLVIWMIVLALRLRRRQ